MKLSGFMRLSVSTVVDVFAASVGVTGQEEVVFGGQTFCGGLCIGHACGGASVLELTVRFGVDDVAEGSSAQNQPMIYYRPD